MLQMGVSPDSRLGCGVHDSATISMSKSPSPGTSYSRPSGDEFVIASKGG